MFYRHLFALRDATIVGSSIRKLYELIGYKVDRRWLKGLRERAKGVRLEEPCFSTYKLWFLVRVSREIVALEFSKSIVAVCFLHVIC